MDINDDNGVIIRVHSNTMIYVNKCFIADLLCKYSDFSPGWVHWFQAPTHAY